MKSKMSNILRARGIHVKLELSGQEFESRREVYDRCLVARQEKLDFLTVKVQQSYKNVSHSDLPLFVLLLPISI